MRRGARLLFEYIISNEEKYILLVGEHLTLTVTALVICALVGLVIGGVCYRNSVFNSVSSSMSSALRVVPSIALMLLFMPIMGIGRVPAITALVIIGLPPVLINTALGLQSTDRSLIEAAEACAMSAGRIFFKVRLPLALPMILTGLRLAGLSVASGAILAAYIGAGGLGELILSGMSQYRMDMLFAGAVTTMAISLSIEVFFQLLVTFATRYRKT